MICFLSLWMMWDWFGIIFFSAYVVIDLVLWVCCIGVLAMEKLICVVVEYLSDSVLWVWFIVDFNFNVFVNFNFVCVASVC